MDFSWVKELAEQANQRQVDKAEAARQERRAAKEMALATPPLVERIYLLTVRCAEEYNKYILYPQLKVNWTRLQKRMKRQVNPEDPEFSHQEESAFFTISRNNWTFGVRGSSGNVEFIEMPGLPSGAALDFRVDDAAVTPSKKLEAVFDEKSGQVSWLHDQKPVDGNTISTICQNHFRTFIDKTND